MTGRAARLERLLVVTEGRERLLQEEVQRRALARRQVETEMQSLHAPAPLHGAATAAAHCHRERYAEQLEEERAGLRERLAEAGAQLAEGRADLREVAQTRRTLERLLGRLEEQARARRRRDEQRGTDEYAQRYARE